MKTESIVQWGQYRKIGWVYMRPYIDGETLDGVSVSACDTPGPGGMIAMNPANCDDQWYVAADFFQKHYECCK